MKQLALITLAIGLLTAVSDIAWGYEVETHEEMSQKAVEASVISKDTKLLPELGLQPLSNKQKFPNSKNSDQDIINLFRDGANFEDAGTRSTNHFYDPVHNVPLSVPLLTTSMSPDWALEDKGSIGGQEFSYKWARQYFYDALTKGTKDERDQNFGKTFETLGHVIHHLQDMAQPQHVRNDPHCDAIIPCLIPGALAGKYSPSLYEKYTKGKGSNLPFDGYAPLFTDPNAVVFGTPRKLWRTSPEGQADISQGRGIAEFTNRNFVSAGTNFDKPGLFPSPVFNPSNKEEVDIKALIPSTDLSGIVTFYGNTVQDTFRPSETHTNPRASTESIFDAELKKAGYEPVFTLNRFNFDEAHKFLIPRAVAYSAGLIDYFFRGRLEAEDVAFTDAGITLKVKNAIDPEKTPAWANEILHSQSGTLVISYQFKLNGQDMAGVSNIVPLAENLAPGQVSQNIYSFTLPVFPDGAAGVQYRLVFRGRLGQEEGAVAAGPVKPLSGFVVTPSYTPADGITGPRQIFRQGSKWLLSGEKGLQVGNIDWKGWYVNDRPTKVLSWTGTPSRHFPISSNPLATSIYQNGELYSVAPGLVLGAALMKDGAGQEWLVAICKADMSDIVYRRPNTQNVSPGMYDVNTNPEGWQEIGNFPFEAGLQEADRPWFFNGTGTEAQTLRRDTGVLQNGLTRLKINIDGDTARRTRLGNLEGITWIYDQPEKVIEESGGVTPPMECSTIGGPYTSSANSQSRKTVTNTRTGNGSYIIAADYDDDKEILATLTVAWKDVRSWSQFGNSNNAYVWQCGSQGLVILGVTLDQASGFEYADSVNSETRLTFGDTTLEVEKRLGDIATSRVSTSVGPSDQVVQDQILSAGGAVTLSFKHIQYLDMRSGLVAYIRDETTRNYNNLDEIVSELGYGLYANVGEKNKMEQFVQYKNTLLEVKTNSPVLDIPVREDMLYFLSSYIVAALPGFESTAKVPRLPVPSSRFSGYGSWAVDAGKSLVVSQARSSKDSRQVNNNNFIPSYDYSLDANAYDDGNYTYASPPFFNYLTEGELVPLIPLAPQDAIYHPVGVIK